MLWNSLMKNPVLTLGIILFGMFLYQVASKEKWGIFANQKLISSTCKAVVIQAEKRVPANWKLFCEGNNLAVEIVEIAIPPKASHLEALMYRQLANHMSYIAKVSHADMLEKVDFVRFRLTHENIEINAVTEGKFIVKLATLESPEHIMTHLKSTVQVKQTVK